MGWQYIVLILPILSAMSTVVLLGACSLRCMQAHGQSSELATFFAMNVGLAFWIGFTALKLLQTDPVLRLLSYRFLYFGVAPLGALTFPFMLPHTDRISRTMSGPVAMVMTAPIVSLVVLSANPNGLTIKATRLVKTNGFAVLWIGVGPGHIVLRLFYNTMLSVLVIVLILYEAARLGRMYIPQTVLMSVDLATPFVFVTCSSLGTSPFNGDGANLVPTSAAITSAAISIALSRYRFLDLPLIAYVTAMKEPSDGVFALSVDKRIVHVNTRGVVLLERFGAAVGDPVTVVSPDLDLTTEQNDSTGTIREGGETVYPSARFQRLKRDDQTVGWVTVLCDVTELHRQKQTILSQSEKFALLNQIVRHDIQSDVVVILDNAQLVEESADDEALCERLDTMIRDGKYTIELTVNVRNLMATMLDDEETNRPMTLTGPLWAETNAIRDETSEAVISLPGELPDVTAVTDDMLRAVFHNPLMNAIRYNDADRVETDVSVETRDDDAFVRIADNRSDVSDDRKEVVFGCGEKGFEGPGTGPSLYLVDTIVSGYGGDMWVGDSESRGAVLVVCL